MPNGTETAERYRSEPCPSCDGTGETHVTDERFADPVQCRLCDGRGRVRVETDGDGDYQCFESGCEEDFDSLDEMVRIDGKDDRDGRHFCRYHAHRIVNGYGRSK